MKRKTPTLLILLVMALVGAMYWVDLSYYTDVTTGFVTRGPVWARYLVLLLPLFMVLLGLRTVGPRAIAVMRVKSTGLAVAFFAGTLSGVVFGVSLLTTAFSPISVYRIVMGVMMLWYGLWMFLCGLQLLLQNAPSPTRGALPGILAALPFCVLTIRRVVVEPSSLYRIGPMVSALAALLAMLWFGMLLRALYIALPQKRVRWMYFLGVFTFLLCTCLELPQSIHGALFRGRGAVQVLESITLGVFGIVAGAVSVAIAGQSETQPASSAGTAEQSA